MHSYLMIEFTCNIFSFHEKLVQAIKGQLMRQDPVKRKLNPTLKSPYLSVCWSVTKFMHHSGILHVCINDTRIMDTCIMKTYVMATIIMDTCIMDTCILHNGHMHHRYISVGHMAGATIGRERQSQACTTGSPPMGP